MFNLLLIGEILMQQEAREFLDSIDSMPFIRSHNYGIGISRYEFFAFLWSNTIEYWHENNDGGNAKCPNLTSYGLKHYLICRYGDGRNVSSICKDEREISFNRKNAEHLIF